MKVIELAAWPQAQHLQRVFKIKSGDSLGTATVLDIDNKQYVVTALHVAANFPTVSSIDISRDNKWVTFPGALVGVEKEADILIFALKDRLTPKNLSIDISAKGCIAGQEVFFLGYPFGIHGHLVEPGFPLPVIKRGIAALFEPAVPHRRILLSATANPGFSGGPVFFCDVETGRTNLMAILIESLGFEAEVMDKNRKSIGTVTIDSGMVRCTYIDVVLDLIKKNPIGLPID